MEDNITLQQGLEKFNTKNMKSFAGRSISEEGVAFLKCHDIAHVVFGCDTTIYGEGIVKIWTTFGTTLSFWQVIGGYNEVNAIQLFKMYSFRHVIKNILQFLVVIPKTIVREKRMSKLWPFLNYRTYLNTPISEVRREFNIQVL